MNYDFSGSKDYTKFSLPVYSRMLLYLLRIAKSFIYGLPYVVRCYRMMLIALVKADIKDSRNDVYNNSLKYKSLPIMLY